MYDRMNSALLVLEAGVVIEEHVVPEAPERTASLRVVPHSLHATHIKFELFDGVVN